MRQSRHQCDKGQNKKIKIPITILGMRNYPKFNSSTHLHINAIYFTGTRQLKNRAGVYKLNPLHFILDGLITGRVKIERVVLLYPPSRHIVIKLYTQ